MRISFASKRLQRNFNSERELVRAYGRDRAMVIQRRMAVLAEAGSLAEVPTMRPDRCHAMKGDRKGQYAVDLVHPFRLAFAPDHDPLPRRAGGGIDLTAVTAIVILEVVDYHD